MIGPQQTTPTTNDCTIPSQKKKRLPYYLLTSREMPGTYELRERQNGGDSTRHTEKLSREAAASLYLKMNDPELTCTHFRGSACTLGDVQDLAPIFDFQVLHNGQVLVIHLDGDTSVLSVFSCSSRGYAQAIRWMCQGAGWGE